MTKPPVHSIPSSSSLRGGCGSASVRPRGTGGRDKFKCQKKKKSSKKKEFINIVINHRERAAQAVLTNQGNKGLDLQIYFDCKGEIALESCERRRERSTTTIRDEMTRDRRILVAVATNTKGRLLEVSIKYIYILQY